MSSSTGSLGAGSGAASSFRSATSSSRSSFSEPGLAFPDVFVEEAISRGVAILPSSSLGDFSAGEKVRITCPFLLSCRRPYYEFEITQIQAFSSLDEMISQVAWKTLVPWVSSEAEAIGICKEVLQEGQTVAAISVKLP